MAGPAYGQYGTQAPYPYYPQHNDTVQQHHTNDSEKLASEAPPPYASPASTHTNPWPLETPYQPPGSSYHPSRTRHTPYYCDSLPNTAPPSAPQGRPHSSPPANIVYVQSMATPQAPQAWSTPAAPLPSHDTSMTSTSSRRQEQDSPLWPASKSSSPEKPIRASLLSKNSCLTRVWSLALCVATAAAAYFCLSYSLNGLGTAVTDLELVKFGAVAYMGATFGLVSAGNLYLTCFGRPHCWTEVRDFGKKQTLTSFFAPVALLALGGACLACNAVERKVFQLNAAAVAKGIRQGWSATPTYMVTP